jgi:hypothetical protein
MRTPQKARFAHHFTIHPSKGVMPKPLTHSSCFDDSHDAKKHGKEENGIYYGFIQRWRSYIWFDKILPPQGICFRELHGDALFTGWFCGIHEKFGKKGGQTSPSKRREYGAGHRERMTRQSKHWKTMLPGASLAENSTA